MLALREPRLDDLIEAACLIRLYALAHHDQSLRDAVAALKVLELGRVSRLSVEWQWELIRRAQAFAPHTSLTDVDESVTSFKSSGMAGL